MEPSADKQFRATLMLADAATVAEGKLNVLGGGWNITGPGPVQFAIAVWFEVPWHLTNTRHTFRFDLIDIDGNPVGPVGADEPMVIQGEFEVGRPPGIRPGTEMPVPMVVQLPGSGSVPARWSVRVPALDQREHARGLAPAVHHANDPRDAARGLARLGRRRAPVSAPRT